MYNVFLMKLSSGSVWQIGFVIAEEGRALRMGKQCMEGTIRT